jgi:hypothetical protein
MRPFSFLTASGGSIFPKKKMRSFCLAQILRGLGQSPNHRTAGAEKTQARQQGAA